MSDYDEKEKMFKELTDDLIVVLNKKRPVCAVLIPVLCYFLDGSMEQIIDDYFKKLEVEHSNKPTDTNAIDDYRKKMDVFVRFQKALGEFKGELNG